MYLALVNEESLEDLFFLAFRRFLMKSKHNLVYSYCYS